MPLTCIKYDRNIVGPYLPYADKNRAATGIVKRPSFQAFQKRDVVRLMELNMRVRRQTGKLRAPRLEPVGGLVLNRGSPVVRGSRCGGRRVQASQYQVPSWLKLVSRRLPSKHVPVRCLWHRMLSGNCTPSTASACPITVSVASR